MLSPLVMLLQAARARWQKQQWRGGKGREMAYRLLETSEKRAREMLRLLARCRRRQRRPHSRLHIAIAG
jgi:hypothetical protein